MEGAGILVAGGGIGGLAAALALARQGRRATVLEAAPEFGAIGYGIQLGPNVLAALEGLGLAGAVLAAGHVPPAILMLDAADGAEIVRIPAGEALRARFGHPYLVIHRVDLHDILLAACRAEPRITLRGGTRLEGVTQDEAGVTVHTGAGTLHGAALIGADGIHSRIRDEIVGDQPRPIGFAAHRSIVPREALPEGVYRPEVVLWAGDGFHIVCYPLRGGREYNIVAVFRTDTHAARLGPEAHAAELARTYRDAHPHMRALLALLSLERRWPIADRDPVRHWSRGRLALLGDAAHATLQSLAQGAGMAVEDAVALGNCVAANPDLPGALRDYAALRRLRTARVQLESRALWETYHLGGIAAEVRRESFAGRDGAAFHDCLEWLWRAPALSPRAAAAPPPGRARPAPAA